MVKRKSDQKALSSPEKGSLREEAQTGGEDDRIIQCSHAHAHRSSGTCSQSKTSNKNSQMGIFISPGNQFSLL